MKGNISGMDNMRLRDGDPQNGNNKAWLCATGAIELHIVLDGDGEEMSVEGKGKEIMDHVSHLVHVSNTCLVGSGQSHATLSPLPSQHRTVINRPLSVVSQEKLEHCIDN